MKRLVRNALKTPDGTILVSRSRHDYVTHLDANGKQYMTDGGLVYVHCSAHGDEVDMCVYDDEDHEVLREAAEWGTRGIDGTDPLRWVKIKDMDTDHLATCCDLPYVNSTLKSVMKNELILRLGGWTFE